MFDKDQEIGGPGTVVGSNVKLNGVLKDANDITIHGTVDGEVISDKNVQITETAKVKGPITAQEIIISGKASGTVLAHKKLELTPTGKVYGSIETKDLVIRSGAIFVGKCKMIGHDENQKNEEDVTNIDKENETQKEDKSKDEKNDKKIEDEKDTKNNEKEEKKEGGFWFKHKSDDEKPKYELEK